MEYKVKDYETRYFAGIEYEGGVVPNEPHTIPQLWDDLFHSHLATISDIKNPNKFIGLECYPPDFKETKTFDYFALVETNTLIESTETISTKKLPAGKYISFPIRFSNIPQDIHKVYQYIKENDIKVNRGFDFEDYLEDQDYSSLACETARSPPAFFRKY